MKYDFLDIVLGICLLMIVGGFIFGVATFGEVLYFAGIFVAKKVPAVITK